MVERVNTRLKDQFGARFVMVRGAAKVNCRILTSPPKTRPRKRLAFFGVRENGRFAKNRLAILPPSLIRAWIDGAKGTLLLQIVLL